MTRATATTVGAAVAAKLRHSGAAVAASRSHGIALLLLAAAGSASAGTREDYGYGWPLELEPGRGAYRVILEEPVYARLVDAGLRDLEVLNAAGRPVPFGPVPTERDTPLPATREARTTLPFFRVPSARDAGAERLEIHLTRDADGRLRALDTLIDGAPPASPTLHDLVLDASALDRPIDELELDWVGTPGRDINARFAIEGSHDFEHWHGVVAQATVLELAQGEFRLERRTIELPGSGARYLRLRRLDDGAPLPLQGVTAVLRWSVSASVPAPERHWARATHTATRNAPVAYEYSAPGPLPIERVAIELVTANSVSRLSVQSRDRDDGPWRTHGEVTAFRIEAGGVAVASDDLAIDLTRDRRWRLIANPALDQPPVLRFGYYPEAYALLEQAPGPYVLVAGSHEARRQDYPIVVPIAGLRAQFGRGWELAPARLGPEFVLQGDAALAAPPPPKPVRAWLLWGILVAAALLVIGMVVRLLRAPSRSDA
jgi:hypothetical protein